MSETDRKFGFKLIATDGKARRGEITTPHGLVRTPAFMPVGTQATVKAMYPGQVRETGADVVLGNTYHLMLRPTAERVRQAGWPAQIHELAAHHPDRQWRLSGYVPGAASKAR